ncbi:DNA repair protein RecO [Polaribacter sp. KT 15]|uniref:DNA repair protein RecO n=1 Tax=Polaribacter sp. KT 15 TaxID=1896175 RepID=UPI00090B80BD|nr:DNA repair protein RecO [Polaribacter sp. KT 15]SHM87401.1 DNA replication and repair protein RecO [Polaribacter sp. KT 15]
MAAIKTKAIVLSSLKYSDTSLIVKCFTYEDGLKSYIIKGILKAKKGGIKVAYFQPLTQLTIVANHNNKSTLNTLKEVQVLNPYTSIYRDIVKQSVVLFISEVLSNSIQEEESNTSFYNYLEAGLNWLDSHDKIANFHLLFLLNASRFLGFYPDTTNDSLFGFDLLNGSFSESTLDANVISGNEFYQFKKLLGINFDSIENVSFSKNERQMVLKTIIRYFELHLDGFRKPKSLQILEAVFN